MTQPRDAGDAGPEADLVTLTTARSPAEAQIVAAVLRSADIPAYIGGSMLADEFAVSQRMLNVASVKVQVRRDQLPAAEAALAAARDVDPAELERAALAAAPDPDARPVAAIPVVDRGPRVATVLLGGLCAVFAVLWLSTLRAAEQHGASPLFTAAPTEHGWRYQWRDTGNTAIMTFDRNRNGIDEETRFHDRAGRRFAVSVDADENGIIERSEQHFADGTVHVWIDTDGDALLDRCEVRAADGGLVRTLRYAGTEGWVEVR